MYMQRTTSGAAGNSLYSTTKYMRGASGIGWRSCSFSRSSVMLIEHYRRLAADYFALDITAVTR